MTTVPAELQQAVITVARMVLAAAAHRLPDWEDYPDIGEHDWERVLAEVRQLAAALDPGADVYQAAYQYLAERTNGVAE